MPIPEAASVKVSVAMVTFNHETFIAQAVESVLMQQTNFNYELVIGEDCSTDGTRAIALAYGSRYPERVRLLLRESNQGAAVNFVATLKACRGQYIAILEGDDFWTSPHKLQKQVDYLDAHPDCAYCFHNISVMSEDKSFESWIWFASAPKEIFTLEDLLERNFSPACSVMYRKGLFGEFPDWYYDMSMGDRALHVLNAQYGNIGYVDGVMAVYRVHRNGIWSSRGRLETISEEIKFGRAINRQLNFEYNKQIRLVLAFRYYDLAVEYARRKNRARVVVSLLQSIWLAPLDYPVPMRRVLEEFSPKMLERLRRLKRRILFRQGVQG